MISVLNILLFIHYLSISIFKIHIFINLKYIFIKTVLYNIKIIITKWINISITFWLFVFYFFYNIIKLFGLKNLIIIKKYFIFYSSILHFIHDILFIFIGNIFNWFHKNFIFKCYNEIIFIINFLSSKDYKKHFFVKCYIFFNTSNNSDINFLIIYCYLFVFYNLYLRSEN